LFSMCCYFSSDTDTKTDEDYAYEDYAYED
jgi:hypothetical protein